MTRVEFYYSTRVQSPQGRRERNKTREQEFIYKSTTPPREEERVM
jgi:hypothetical protein